MCIYGCLHTAMLPMYVRICAALPVLSLSLSSNFPSYRPHRPDTSSSLLIFETHTLVDHFPFPFYLSLILRFDLTSGTVLFLISAFLFFCIFSSCVVYCRAVLSWWNLSQNELEIGMFLTVSISCVSLWGSSSVPKKK